MFTRTFYDLVIRKNLLLNPCYLMQVYCVLHLEYKKFKCLADKPLKKCFCNHLVAIENILSESGSWNLSNKIWLILFWDNQLLSRVDVNGIPIFLVPCSVSQCVFFYILLLLNQLTHLNRSLTGVCASYYYKFKKIYRQLEEGDVYLLKHMLCFSEDKVIFSSMQWKNNQSHCPSRLTQLTGSGKFSEFPSRAILPESQLKLNGNFQDCCSDHNTYLNQEQCFPCIPEKFHEQSSGEKDFLPSKWKFVY